MKGIYKIGITLTFTILSLTALSQSATSNLPLISINTNGSSISDEPKTIAQLSVFNKGAGAINSLTDTPVLTCRIGIEVRGSSSQMFPKKSYGFETRTALDSNLNVSVLGLPADNDWILYAPYTDKTFLRDVLVYHLGQQMGHYAPRFVFCELYLNGNYQGIYVLLEKIKQGADRVNIANLKKTDIAGKALSGGYIFKVDKNAGSNNQSWTSLYQPKKFVNKYINFYYHYPKPDVITTEQKTYIKNFVNQFETTLASTTFTDELTGYRKFLNLRSFVDYFIINEVSKNIDGYRISAYFHKDKEDRGNKIIAGPLWDFNLAFGNADYYSGGTTSNWVINSIPDYDDYQVPFWWKRFLEDPVFSDTLKARYAELRQNILKKENIYHFIDLMTGVLQESQVRNYKKWPILGVYVWPNKYIGATFQQEIDYMKGWINDRLQWVDLNMKTMDNKDLPGQIVERDAVAYPNPFGSYLYVEIFPDTKSKNCQIEVSDLTGKKLFLDNIKVSNWDKTLYTLTDSWENAATMVPGIYILKIKFDSGKEFQAKIVKK